MKKTGYIIISKEKISRGEPHLLSTSKKKCVGDCDGGCTCDPETYYYQVFYRRSAALKHKDLLSRVVKATIVIHS